MKKKLILALFAAAAFNGNAVHAQSRQVPVTVTDNFTERFPDAKHAEWKDQLVNFEVTFNNKDKNYRVTFANNGDWMMTERIIKKDYLPSPVTKEFSKSEYAKWEILEVTVVETPVYKSQFKITVAKNNVKKKDLLYNKEGQLLKDAYIF